MLEDASTLDTDRYFRYTLEDARTLVLRHLKMVCTPAVSWSLA